MTPLTPAPPRALSQGSLRSPRQKAQGSQDPPHLERPRWRRDLSTSKTVSFVSYVSSTIPRLGTEPAVGNINVTAWPSRSLGSREKDQMKAKPQMGGAMYMLLLSDESEV